MAQMSGTDWLLVRYTHDGVTASMSSDMTTRLVFADDGAVRISSGLLSAEGTADAQGPGIELELRQLAGAEATAPGSLEDRIVRACHGRFDVQADGPTLRLRRNGTSLDFVRA